MKTITKVLTLFIALTFTQALFSQSYNSAIGLRFGLPTSVSYKKFFKEDLAFEGFIGFRSYVYSSYFNIGAGVQKHNPIASVNNLSWYYGAGAGIYVWSYDNLYIGDNASTGIGILGFLGLDYKFEELPLNLSVDWVPSFFLTKAGGINGFGAGYGALSARYVLK